MISALVIVSGEKSIERNLISSGRDNTDFNLSKKKDTGHKSFQLKV